MLHINTGLPVKLKTLIVSGDIKDESKIQIFNSVGAFLAVGKWYQDQILSYGERFGVATKAGTGKSIKFKLI